MPIRFTRYIGQLFVLLFLIPYHPVAAQRTFDESAGEQSLRQSLGTYFRQQAASGKWFAALVLRDDSTVVLNRGYGWTDSAAARPVTPSTGFAVASLTKVFTAAAILQLAAQGKMSV